MAGSRIRVFDDRDALFQYQGGWFNQGTWNASNLGPGHTGTLSSTNDPNASVKFIFPEEAIAFSYYGIRRSRGGTYGICVDCDPNAQNFQTIDAVDPTDDGKNPPVVLFSTQFPTPGVHEILLRNQPDSRFPNGNSQITLDRFEIKVVDSNPPPPSPTPNPTPTLSSTSTAAPTSTPTPTPTSTPASTSISTSAPISTSTSAPTSISTLTPTPTTTPTQTTPTTPTTTQAPSQDSSKTPIGAIVGGVLGGLALLLVILTFWFWCWRRNRRNEDSGRPGSDGSLTASRPQSSLGRTSTARTGTTRPVVYTREKSTGMQRHNDHQSRLSLISSSDWTSTGTSSGRIYQREVDAGPVRNSEDVETEVLPPDYEQVVGGPGRRTRSNSRLHIVRQSGNRGVQGTGPKTRMRG